jgi:TetR/AcrR family transcriptional regulator, tetracycline repressor protein
MTTNESTSARRSSGRRRPGPGRPPLSTKADVLDATLRVIDEQGLAALSMKRVADELGIGVMTIYGYVNTKEELVDEVTHHALSALTAERRDGSPLERITDAIRALHQALRDHAGVLEVLLNAPAPGPALDPLREDLLTILDEIGITGLPAMDALSILYSYGVGFAVTGRARDRESPLKEQRRMESLSPQRFPHLSSAPGDYSSRLSATAFEAGLRALIASLFLRADNMPR